MSLKTQLCAWLDILGIESEYLDHIDVFIREQGSLLQYPFGQETKDLVARFWAGQDWPELDDEYEFIKKHFPVR